MNKTQEIGWWIVKLTAAIIMLQTLFFKFTAAPESTYIFSVLHIEPFGRIGTGIIELIASILILIPRTTVYGALMGLSTMIGAIFSHLFFLGIVVLDDGGKLFILALITAVCCLVLVFKNREKVWALIPFVYGRKN
ncbi:MAG: DoxX family protein [Bacteroidia bacterium]